MAQAPLYKRRRYLIKKGLQFRYIGLLFSLVFLVSLVTGYTIFYTCLSSFGQKLANVYPQSRLLPIFRTVNLLLLRNLLLISPFILICGLLFSHRIAGPLFRIEKVLGEIGKGKLDINLRLRKTDELWDIARVINSMAANLSKIFNDNKAIVERLQSNANELKLMIASHSPDEVKIKEGLGNIQSDLEALKKILDRWTIQAKET